MEFKTLDLSMDPDEQGFEDRKYDLVVANNAVHTDRNIGESLRNIKKLLHPNGFLILTELCPSSKWINYILGTHSNWWCGVADGRQEQPYIDTKRWNDLLVDAGYGEAEAVVLDAKEPFQLNATMVYRPVVNRFPSKRVGLLCENAVGDTDPIFRALVSDGYEVIPFTIHDHPPPSRDVVAVLDRDNPLFENINSERFNSFKNFLHNLVNAGVLWITQLSQMHCQNPRYAQIIGTARTIRSELLLDFATCEVDEIDKSTAPILQVLAKFQRRNISDSLKPDLEYVICDGAINVGRFYPFTLLDELQVSKENDRVVLDLEIPGRLSTLHWARRPALSVLQPDEVEVEVYSVGLNFRVGPILSRALFGN